MSIPDRIRPLSVLVGALGGDGGGVLTEWLVAAAVAEDFPVQSTSVPGVAQRTGATTYYIEIFPVRRPELGGREPVLALYPSPGLVDLVVASELLEAGRAIENGFVSPDRTTLIASTHRVYAIAEKSAMGDGTADGERVIRAAERMARRTLLVDMARAARDSGSAVNAVLLGAIAGSGELPILPETFEQSIREKGVAVEANLRGFAEGMALVRAKVRADERTLAEAAAAQPLPPALRERLTRDFPAEVRGILADGAARLLDYQGLRYASLYFDRLGPIAGVDAGHGGRTRGHGLLRETGRYLALWMSYEDAIRVADLKTRASRAARVRAEVGAGPTEPVHITEFLDPGLEEICAILPPWLARPVLYYAERHPRLARFRRPMQVRTDTVTGFLKLWLVARLRPWRPFTYRYGDEQRWIDRWLSAVQAAGTYDYDLGLEVAELPRLIKGYGNTHLHGRQSFARIFDALLVPGLAGGGGRLPSASQVRRAREAALADPDGRALEEVLGNLGAGGPAPAGRAPGAQPAG